MANMKNGIWALVTAGVLVSSVAQAEQVTYTGSGTFDQYIGSDVIGLPWGSTFSSSFSADTGSDSAPLNPITGYYAPILRVTLDVQALNLHIDTVPSPVGSVIVSNSQQGYDNFNPNTELRNIPNVGTLGVFWTLQDSSDQALSGKQLPLSLSLGAFNVRRFELDLSETAYCGDKFHSFSGCIVAGTFTTLSVAAVPEPDIYAMMLAGLGLLGVAARRRTQKAVA